MISVAEQQPFLAPAQTWSVQQSGRMLKLARMESKQPCSVDFTLFPPPPICTSNTRKVLSQQTAKVPFAPASHSLVQLLCCTALHTALEESSSGLAQPQSEIPMLHRSSSSDHHPASCWLRQSLCRFCGLAMGDQAELEDSVGHSSLSRNGRRGRNNGRALAEQHGNYHGYYGMRSTTHWPIRSDGSGNARNILSVTESRSRRPSCIDARVQAIVSFLCKCREAARDHVAVRRVERLLDVGCNTGSVTIQLGAWYRAFTQPVGCANERHN